MKPCVHVACLDKLYTYARIKPELISFPVCCLLVISRARLPHKAPAHSQNPPSPPRGMTTQNQHVACPASGDAVQWRQRSRIRYSKVKKCEKVSQASGQILGRIWPLISRRKVARLKPSGRIFIASLQIVFLPRKQNSAADFLPNKTTANCGTPRQPMDDRYAVLLAFSWRFSISYAAGNVLHWNKPNEHEILGHKNIKLEQYQRKSTNLPYLPK